MSYKKTLMKGSTRISLHERFTFLRNQPTERQTVHMEPVREGMFHEQQSSTRNRRLAEMMDRRPTVMAALKLKKRILKQRLGQVPHGVQNVKDRLSLRGKIGLRGRLGQRGNFRGGRGTRGILSRSQSLNTITRSQNIQTIGVRGRTIRGRNRFQNNYNTFDHQVEYRRGRGRGFRARGRGFNRNQDDFQPRRGGGPGRFNNRSQRSRGFRGRGGGRGRGRGGVVSKELLDSELDQYMAGSKGVLDRELDSYMQESWE